MQTSSYNLDQLCATQTAYRVRTQFNAALNADGGWGGGIDESVDVEVDQPFRIRFELELSASEMNDPRFRLQSRRNGGAWNNVNAEDFPKSEESSSRVSIVSAVTYNQGQATTDSLSCSDATYRSGVGVSLSAFAAAGYSDSLSSSSERVQSEWEWPLVIRRFADGGVTNDTGDQFEFRMIGCDGKRVEVETPACVSVIVPAGHLGGTFVETPGRIGPWEASNGDLYFIMEPTETDNLLMIVKSEDQGRTWQEVDTVNRPVTGDLEGVASVVWKKAIHVLHQTSNEVLYHAFGMSDNDSHPDNWIIRDELVAKPSEPPVQVAAIAARSDGSLVGLYGGPAKVHLRVRSSAGIWSAEEVLDADLPPDLSGPQAIVGNGDEVHIAYTGRDGTAWYRRLEPNGVLTPRVRIADSLGATENDVGSILPLVFHAETDTLTVVYRVNDGHLWERRSVAQGSFSKARRVTDRRVIQNAVDSDQTGADIIAEGSMLHVLFIDEKTGGIYWTSAKDDGPWSHSKPRVVGIRGQWVRVSLLHHSGSPSIGFIYDAGSDGGSGMNRFQTVPITPP